MFRLLVFLILAIPVHADVVSEVENELKGRVAYLRHFPKGGSISYDRTGNTSALKGIWSIDGVVQIERLRIENGHLVLTGRRLVAIFDHKNMEFTYGRTSSRTHVRIPVDPPTSKDDVRKAILVFTVSQQEMPDVMPPFWREFWSKAGRWKSPDDKWVPPSGVESVRLNPKVKPPKAIYTPDPSYNLEAREMQLKGMSVFRLIVDEKGAPTELTVVRPAGAGFDEQVYKTLQTWKFQPGTKDGLPVKVGINVEVNFSLY